MPQEGKIELTFKNEEIKLTILTEQKGKIICSSLLMQKKHLTDLVPIHDFLKKNLSETKNKRDFFKSIRGIYKKLTADVIFYGKK